MLRRSYVATRATLDVRSDARETPARAQDHVPAAHFASYNFSHRPFFFFCGAATQRGSWPPRSWGFLDHIQRRTTVGRTPLDEWSARRRDLYLTTHNTHNRQTSMPPGGIRTHDLSRRAAADLRLWPRGHWDRHRPQLQHCKSSLGATTSFFERFGLLNIQFPLIAILDAASPVLYFPFLHVIQYCKYEYMYETGHLHG